MSSPATPARDNSVTLTGVSQTLFANAGFNGVQERIIHNPDAANPIAINLAGNPAVLNGKGSIQIAAGGYWSGQVTGAITVIGTAGSFATAYER